MIIFAVNKFMPPNQYFFISASLTDLIISRPATKKSGMKTPLPPECKRDKMEKRMRGMQPLRMRRKFIFELIVKLGTSG
jgi:hypothetical protein